MTAMRPVVTDAQMREALRIPADVAPSPDFMSSLMAHVATNRQRRSRFGELVAARWQPAMIQLILLMLLILILAFAAYLGSRRDAPSVNGSVATVVGDQLEMIDPVGAKVLTNIATDGLPSGVARSPDGRRVVYFTVRDGRSQLWLVTSDGGSSKRIAENVDWSIITETGGLLFSPDGRQAATDVTTGGLRHLLVVDLVSGDGQLLAPEQGASSPVFSADGERLAFNEGHGALSFTSIAVIGRDGTGLAELTYRDLNTHGADSWSRDGWIYFGADAKSPGINGFEHANGVYRVNDDVGLAPELLTGDQIADAAALSPDETRVAYMGWTEPGLKPDLWIMTADGADRRMLYPKADIRGWSADGAAVLAEIDRGAGNADLASIPIDGGPETVLLSANGCGTRACFDDVSWGFPRP